VTDALQIRGGGGSHSLSAKMLSLQSYWHQSYGMPSCDWEKREKAEGGRGLGVSLSGPKKCRWPAGTAKGVPVSDTKLLGLQSCFCVMMGMRRNADAGLGHVALVRGGGDLTATGLLYRMQVLVQIGRSSSCRMAHLRRQKDDLDQVTEGPGGGGSHH